MAMDSLIIRQGAGEGVAGPRPKAEPIIEGSNTYHYHLIKYDGVKHDAVMETEMYERKEVEDE